MVYLFTYFFGTIRWNSYLRGQTMLENKKKPTIVLPEGNEERILLAAKQVLKEAFCRLIIIGDAAYVASILGDLSGYSVVSPDKGVALARLQQARIAAGKKELAVPYPNLVQAAEMVRDGTADGVVGGAEATTDVVAVVFAKVIGLKAGFNLVYDCFKMEKGDQVLVFANCALLEVPTTEQRAEIAILAGEFARFLGLDPKVALLDYQTVGNAPRPLPQETAHAVQIALQKADFPVDGPLQLDAAVNKTIAAKKAPDSQVAGNANVLVFPDLRSGNIGYKNAAQLGGWVATGPILLGTKKPANDLSRGSTVEEIVSTIKLTALQV